MGVWVFPDIRPRNQASVEAKSYNYFRADTINTLDNALDLNSNHSSNEDNICEVIVSYAETLY